MTFAPRGILADTWSEHWRPTGQPAASIPCGLTGDGLPVGLQVIGPRFAEATVLRACRAFEAALGLAQPHAKLLESLAAIAASP